MKLKTLDVIHLTSVSLSSCLALGEDGIKNSAIPFLKQPLVSQCARGTERWVMSPLASYSIWRKRLSWWFICGEWVGASIEPGWRKRFILLPQIFTESCVRESEGNMENNSWLLGAHTALILQHLKHKRGMNSETDEGPLEVQKGDKSVCVCVCVCVYYTSKEEKKEPFRWRTSEQSLRERAIRPVLREWCGAGCLAGSSGWRAGNREHFQRPALYAGERHLGMTPWK
jgi:hypothetical protein